MTDVSVVVSTYTEERFRYVLNCINSLRAQTFRSKEIIFVLDPDDKLVEFYRARVPRDVRLIISKGQGLSKARNMGVENAKGDIVAFIDDDAVADRNWLKNLSRNYEDPHVVGVGGLVKSVWENGRPKWFPEELDWIVGCSYKGLPRERTLVRNPLGCNMAFKKSVFDEVGYFGSAFGRIGKMLMSGEEAEFSMRVWRRIPHAKIVYDPAAVVYHMVPKSRVRLKHFLNRSFCEGVSKAVISKHRPNPVDTLYMEKNYMKNLLSVTIPMRLVRCYKPKNLSQVLAILLSASVVLVGYLARRAGR